MIIRECIERLMDCMLIMGIILMGFSFFIHSIQNPVDDKWFFRHALAFIIMGLWLIQSRLKTSK